MPLNWVVTKSWTTSYYFRKRYNRRDKTFPEIRIYELSELSIKSRAVSNKHRWAKSRIIEALVTEIIEARECDVDVDVSSQEADLDTLVYELYELTPEEITLVEGGT